MKQTKNPPSQASPRGALKGRSQQILRRILLPLLLLSCLALLAFWCLFLVDLSGGQLTSLNVSRGVSRFFDFDAEALGGVPGDYTEVVAATLGIIVTVVSIVLQLSAARFAGITRMFLRDPVNVVVIGYYVVVCMLGLWVSLALRVNSVPELTMIAFLLLTTCAVALVVPYFGYVFSFLEPQNIIRTLLADALETAERGALVKDKSEVERAQARLILTMEELTDIVSSSLSNRDKVIASQAADALKDLAIGYLSLKPSARPAWFEVTSALSKNPDFVAMDPESLADQARKKTWVEWKALRQCLGIYNEALSGMRDMTYLVAINTRYIGAAAVGAGDTELMRLVYRFMNSYLRSALNAKDVRTAYNVLNQYRLYVECLLQQGHELLAVEGIGHMVYYGHVSFDMKLTFVTETVAYDISTLCELAHQLEAEVELVMLDRFLELDRPLRAQSQEAALIGVRKAQAKLGAYYLALGQNARAERIALDMRDEPTSRLSAIASQLGSVTSREFWEITDRGRNFEYMDERQRAQLVAFFALIPDKAAN